MIAISIGNGGGDAQGSERGLEYDAMNGRYQLGPPWAAADSPAKQ